MTSHLNSHMTTDIKPEMLSGFQTGNGTPYDKYNIRGIAHARTNRKEDIFMQRRLYIDEATRRWTYSALRYFYRKNKAEVSTFLLNVALLKRKIANGPVHPA